MTSNRLTTFGELDGNTVHAVEIRSPDHSTSANIITFGAAIQDLRVPVTGTDPRSVILGFDNIADYHKYKQWHQGAVAGRVANRIANGRFSLDGVNYDLVTNESSGHICHGGQSGFGHKIWSIKASGEDWVTLEYISPDGEQGFPGTVTAQITYSLPASGVIRLDYKAITDKTCPINLTNHSFFNLDGTSGAIGDTLDQKLTIDADHYTAVDQGLIPTGELADVSGTPFDFRASRPIRYLDDRTGTLFHYDLNYALRSGATPGVLHRGAELISSHGDLTMECWTDQPGIQFFDGAPMDLDANGLGGARLTHRTGICLETQIFPDSLHHEHFPQSIIRPGEIYTHRTEYRFTSA